MFSLHTCSFSFRIQPLQWRHNERDGVSNHQPHDCLLNRLFRRRPKKTSKPHVIGLSKKNSQVTGEFPTQRANAENVSIWWRHHEETGVSALVMSGGLLHHCSHNRLREWLMMSEGKRYPFEYRQTSNISRAKSQHLMSRSQVSSKKWRCSWSSAVRRCSNYIWVSKNFIAYWGASYIRGSILKSYCSVEGY